MVDEKSLRLYRNETICLDLKKNNNNQNDFALPQKCSGTLRSSLGIIILVQQSLCQCLWRVKKLMVKKQVDMLCLQEIDGKRASGYAMSTEN